MLASQRDVHAEALQWLEAASCTLAGCGHDVEHVLGAFCYGVQSRANKSRC